MSSQAYIFNFIIFWIIGSVLILNGEGFGGLAYSISGTLFLVCSEIKNSKVIIRHTHYSNKDGASNEK